jgi:hypothetical protein
MTKQAEPEYRTIYKDQGKHICPETGVDLTNFSKDGVLAHTENLFPNAARANFSEEAIERRNALIEIANAKEK